MRIEQPIGRLVRRTFGQAGLLAIGAVSVALAIASTGGTAEAQTPTTPQAGASCSGTLTLTPATIFSGGQREVQIAATGLEADAQYTVSVNGQALLNGTTVSNGSTTVVVLLRPLFASLVPVQVSTTNGSCAVATLTVVGPAFMPCVFTTATASGFACPFVFRPLG